MNLYAHILYAVDLHEDTAPVTDQVEDLARLFQARVSLIHVVETAAVGSGMELVPPIPGAVVPVAGEVDPASELTLEEQLLDNARARLAQLGERLGVPKERQRVEASSAVASRVRHTAEELQADLIVVGSHGRHGLALLLGSTANAVLHGAPCDVLAVRVK